MRSNIYTALFLATLTLQYVLVNCESETTTMTPTQTRCPSHSSGRSSDGLSRLMNVNIPLFYDMVRNGSSLGLNVLSGLVKVERGDEAEKNGLMGNGRRPLSIRIFGVPVYERGVRVRPPSGAAEPEAEADASAEPLATET